MKSLKRVFTLVFVFAQVVMYAQGTLSGTMMNPKTGAPVLGAKIYLESTIEFSTRLNFKDSYLAFL